MVRKVRELKPQVLLSARDLLPALSLPQEGLKRLEVGLNPGSWQRAGWGLLELAARCLTNVALPTNHTSATAAKNKAVSPHRHFIPIPIPVPSTQRHDQPLHGPVIQRAHPCQRGFPKCLPLLGLGASNAATTTPTSVVQGSVGWGHGSPLLSWHPSMHPTEQHPILEL